MEGEISRKKKIQNTEDRKGKKRVYLIRFLDILIYRSTWRMTRQKIYKTCSKFQPIFYTRNSFKQL